MHGTIEDMMHLEVEEEDNVAEKRNLSKLALRDLAKISSVLELGQSTEEAVGVRRESSKGAGDGLLNGVSGAASLVLGSATNSGSNF